MVSLAEVRRSNTAVLAKQPITAVFTGATQGIGEYALRQLVLAHGADGPGLRIYLVGRNEQLAKIILDDCKVVCPSGEFQFIRSTDLALLREVDRVCNEITAAETKAAEGKPPRVDLLVMTQAYFALGDRLKVDVTPEGLQSGLSLLYYSRMRFTTQLLPLLSASPLGGRVVSVFGGPENTLHQGDLALLQPEHLAFLTQGSHTSWMTTFFFERLAEQHRGKISLSNYFPGLVITPVTNRTGVPIWFKLAFAVLLPVVLLVRISNVECGQRVVYHTSERFRPGVVEDGADKETLTSTDGIKGGGAYKVNTKADLMPLPKVYGSVDKDALREKVWEHTMKVFDEIGASGKFTP